MIRQIAAIALAIGVALPSDAAEPVTGVMRVGMPIIADTLDAGLIKPFDPANRSRKHARYVPYWA